MALIEVLTVPYSYRIGTMNPSNHFTFNSNRVSLLLTAEESMKECHFELVMLVMCCAIHLRIIQLHDASASCTIDKVDWDFNV